jgi:hypothetical protein
MHHETEIGLMIKNGEHVAAAHKLVEMLERNGGNIMHVAIEAKVDRSTLKRWIQRLATAGYPIGGQLARLRDEAGDTRTMPADETAQQLERNRRDLELGRVRLWLQRSEAARVTVAQRAKTTEALVQKVAEGGRVPTEVRERVLRIALRALVAQRRDWRDARLRRTQAKR